MSAIRIDPEFKALLPVLSDDEREALRENLILDGCRDPLVLWGDILLDGHNRYEICTAEDIPFETVQAEHVGSRESARQWMLKNQLGKRNLTREQQSYYRGRLYNEIKSNPGAPKGNQNAAKQSGHSDHFEKTADKVAKQTGVSDKTVRRDAKYAEAVDVLVGDGLPLDKLTGKDKPLPKKDAVRLAKMDDGDRKEAVRLLRAGAPTESTGRQRHRRRGIRTG